MNSVNLVGNLVKEVELKFLPGNSTAVVKNTLAVKRDKENTDFIPVTIWGKAAETLANYCAKGSKIGVEGSIKTGSYNNKDGVKVYTTEVSCMRIHLLDSKKQADTSQSNDMELVEDSSDIPF